MSVLRIVLLCAGGLALAGLIGAGLGEPWLFPSLGPTLMVLAETPHEPSAAPMNVVVGHAVAIGCAFLALTALGLRHDPSVVMSGVTGPRTAAAVLALTVTAVLLHLARRPHPPAGATALIVSLASWTPARSSYRSRAASCS